MTYHNVCSEVFFLRRSHRHPASEALPFRRSWFLPAIVISLPMIARSLIGMHHRLGRLHGAREGRSVAGIDRPPLWRVWTG